MHTLPLVLILELMNSTKLNRSLKHQKLYYSTITLQVTIHPSISSKLKGIQIENYAHQGFVILTILTQYLILCSMSKKKELTVGIYNFQFHIFLIMNCIIMAVGSNYSQEQQVNFLENKYISNPIDSTKDKRKQYLL